MSTQNRYQITCEYTHEHDCEGWGRYGTFPAEPWQATDTIPSDNWQNAIQEWIDNHVDDTYEVISKNQSEGGQSGSIEIWVEVLIPPDPKQNPSKPRFCELNGYIKATPIED